MVDDKVIWTRTPFPKDLSKSIFLAGPTPRDRTVSSWRGDAILTLRKLGWDGWIIAPESKDVVECNFEYGDQIEWEEEGLMRATVIMFWVPRKSPRMPAFTTNVEFGMWCRSGKVVLGAPDDAEKMKYLFYYARKFYIPNFNNLDDTAKAAIKMAQK